MDDLYDEYVFLIPLLSEARSACTNDEANRFGNFIGEEVESEEGSEVGVDADAYVYDDEADDAAPGVTGQELMEIDGKSGCVSFDLRPLDAD
jgi:hypothetical protein